MTGRNLAAFIIAPIKKARSCPTLMHMTQPVSPTTIQKEIAIGTAMAITSVFLSGDHHHITTLDEIKDNLTMESVNIITNLKYEKSPILAKIYKLKKYKLFVFALLLPIIIRLLSFTTFQFLF